MPKVLRSLYPDSDKTSDRLITDITSRMKQAGMDQKHITRIQFTGYKPNPTCPRWSEKEERYFAEPDTADKLIAQAIKDTLTKEIDPQLYEHAYAYRPKRGPAQAIQSLKNVLEETDTPYLFQFDIEEFFDSIDWRTLIKILSQTLKVNPNSQIITLLAKIIHQPLRIRGKKEGRSRGILQGNPLSPFLSHIYLKNFDQEMASRFFRYVRYADDFIVIPQNEGKPIHEVDLETFTTVVKRLHAIKLRVNPGKRYISTQESPQFTFVGESLSIARASEGA